MLRAQRVHESPRHLDFSIESTKAYVDQGVVLMGCVVYGPACRSDKKHTGANSIASLVFVCRCCHRTCHGRPLSTELRDLPELGSGSVERKHFIKDHISQHGWRHLFTIMFSAAIGDRPQERLWAAVRRLCRFGLSSGLVLDDEIQFARIHPLKPAVRKMST